MCKNRGRENRNILRERSARRSRKRGGGQGVGVGGEVRGLKGERLTPCPLSRQEQIQNTYT